MTNSANITGLYQVYDKTAESMSGPILSARKDGAAIRHFFDGLATPGTTLNEHPEDYELRMIGYQDLETGIIIDPMPEPVTITTGTVWKEIQAQKAAISNQDK